MCAFYQALWSSLGCLALHVDKFYRLSMSTRTLPQRFSEEHINLHFFIWTEHATARRCLTASTLDTVDHPGDNVQLAKLIVNSGGAAALVDYVAEAQASAFSLRLCQFSGGGSPESVTHRFNIPQSSYFQPPDLFHNHWDHFPRLLHERFAWVDGSQIWTSLLHFAAQFDAFCAPDPLKRACLPKG